MKELSEENSAEQAPIIGQINSLSRELDVEYLTMALADMRDKHSFRESAAVLSPSPFTHNEQQDLNAAKLEQLSLMLQLAKNSNKIIECTVNLAKAKQN